MQWTSILTFKEFMQMDHVTFDILLMAFLCTCSTIRRRINERFHDISTQMYASIICPVKNYSLGYLKSPKGVQTLFKSKMFTLVFCNFSKSQGGKIQTLLELSYHSHLKKEGMTAAIAGHRRRGGRSKPYPHTK